MARIVINPITGHVGKLLRERPAKQQHGAVSDFIHQWLQRTFAEDLQIRIEETFGVLFHGKYGVRGLASRVSRCISLTLIKSRSLPATRSSNTPILTNSLR